MVEQGNLRIVTGYSGEQPVPLEIAVRMVWECQMVLSGHWPLRWPAVMNKTAKLYLARFTMHPNPRVALQACRACRRFGVGIPQGRTIA